MTTRSTRATARATPRASERRVADEDRAALAADRPGELHRLLALRGDPDHRERTRHRLAVRIVKRRDHHDVAAAIGRVLHGALHEHLVTVVDDLDAVDIDARW